MASWTKVKEWVNENAPVFAVIYQNKYVGMVYDRFGSLPAKQQKQLILTSFSCFVSLLVIFLGFSYYSLWSYSSNAKEAYQMIGMLQQYEKECRDKSTQIQSLDRNAQLAPPGELKQQLLNQARTAAISPRLIQVEEKADGEEKDDESKGGHDVKMKQATVTMERVNLQQLKDYLAAVELGPFNLSISSVKITNDDKIRGYMKVELGVVAYLFPSEEAG